MLKWVQILWASFLAAVVAQTLFFTVIDPQQLYFMGEEIHLSDRMTMTVGFFLFWLVCAVSSMLTLLITREVKDTADGVQSPPGASGAAEDVMPTSVQPSQPDKEQ